MTNSSAIRDVVILGGGYAGIIAATRLSHKVKHLPVKLTLVDANPGLVERIRLHQVAAGQPIKAIPYQQLLKGTNVEFIQARVSRIDPVGQCIELHQSSQDGNHQSNQDGNHQNEQDQHQTLLHYDRLIYALGSTVDKNSVPGIAEYTHTLGSFNSAIELHEQLQALAGRTGKVVICGGGLTGIESAAELAERYPNLKITLVTGDRFAERLSLKAQEYLRNAFARFKIEIKDQRRIIRIDANTVHLANNDNLRFDLCLWAGAMTVSPLARAAGLRVNALGLVVVDAMLRSSSHPSIYAAGDSATIADHAELRMACATAVPMGAHAADNIAAEIGQQRLQDFSLGYNGQCISLGRHDAVIQMSTKRDQPIEKIFSGWLGSMIKEIICRYTIWSIRLQQRGWFDYRWPKVSIGKKVIAPLSAKSTQEI